jgi:hypothetical protein
MTRKGRPTKDPSERRLNVQVAPPADLDAHRLALWNREFARMPAGYFTPTDVRGMLLYLDAIDMYDRARNELAEADANGEDNLRPYRKEVRLAFAAVHRLQRDLRMYPATRTLREVHGVLANNPTAQSTQPGEDGWRGLFAVPSTSAKTAKK